jgi:hypothetical protein
MAVLPSEAYAFDTSALEVKEHTIWVLFARTVLHFLKSIPALIVIDHLI